MGRAGKAQMLVPEDRFPTVRHLASLEYIDARQNLRLGICNCRWLKSGSFRVFGEEIAGKVLVAISFRKKNIL